jgi:uncharacterized spore protein YtfJ
MSINTSNHEKTEINSTSLALESLTMNYSNLLRQYQQAVIDYNSYLTQIGSNDVSANALGYISSHAFLGGSILSQNIQGNVEQCMATCSATTGCSGATFNIDSSNCTLFSGQGHAVSSTQNQFAIVPETSILLSNIENITRQLNSVNDQIQSVIKNSHKKNDKEKKDSKREAVKLMKKYDKLNAEREAIKSSIKLHSTLDSDYNEGSLTVSKNYYSFLLLMFIAIIFIIALIQLSTSTLRNNNSEVGYSASNVESGGVLGTKAYYILFGLILCIPLSYFVLPIVYYISQIDVKGFILRQEDNTSSFFSGLLNKLKRQS